MYYYDDDDDQHQHHHYYKCHGLECCQSHSYRGTLQNLDIKLLHSSVQTSADYRSRWRHVSRMTDEKGETWSPSGMSKVRSRPESLVADWSMHVLQPPERRGRRSRVARRVDGTCSVAVSAERRHRQPTISDVVRRLSDRYAGAVPCTQWYARTHNWN